MQKLNFNAPLHNLDGTIITDNGTPITLAKALANNLAEAKTGDPIKLYEMALRLYRSGELELDQSDWLMLKQFVTDLPGVAVLYKAQLLERFILSPKK